MLPFVGCDELLPFYLVVVDSQHYSLSDFSILAIDLLCEKKAWNWEKLIYGYSYYASNNNTIKKDMNLIWYLIVYF
jgi:hypothetical protein